MSAVARATDAPGKSWVLRQVAPYLFQIVKGDSLLHDETITLFTNPSPVPRPIDDAMLARAERAYMAKTTRGKRTRDMLRIVIASALGGAK